MKNKYVIKILSQTGSNVFNESRIFRGVLDPEIDLFEKSKS